MSQDSNILEAIRSVRATNNSLWMEVLAIALRKSPDETKRVLRMIRENDTMISDLTGKLADGD